MIDLRLIVLIIVIAAAALGGWTARGWKADADIDELRAELAGKQITAVQEARAIERKQQENADEAARKKNEALQRINGRLADELERLRNRPERPAGVSEAPRIGCEGANGAELGGSHARFLAGIAARAARQDAALAECYEVIDGLHRSP